MTPLHDDSNPSRHEMRPSPTRGDILSPPQNATLLFISQGRGGTVRYRDHRTAFDMWWEFALPPAVAIIGVAGVDTWERDTGLSLDERDRTLEWIADRALRERVSSAGVFRIGEMHITLFREPVTDLPTR